ncbi:hypothetical protein ASPZODRAFT_27163 [Penicilliopsis zonata CBS 506.65]|uniref:Zn(2)-C6 fungal-type domain-containing protein n=1 Tax=Penicilliopsis zonata CBS 506.65 TaxID=1073090 RepID=A0A1L9SD72_9EURO|nr:hypothetical protein ASPZODRAFT_27163 [Penicilliopsis zonata CBS 506.65]OJJ45170.1 hypothetical protein ASPZODRAFT_27163 [Penicilliopsis zonata CBS 506.65]
MPARNFHSKSRDGCLRCKANRVKCDEQKPACLRCQDRKLPCPGYRHHSLRWLAKHQQGIDRHVCTPASPRSTSTEPVFVFELMPAPSQTVDSDGHDQPIDDFLCDPELSLSDWVEWPGAEPDTDAIETQPEAASEPPTAAAAAATLELSTSLCHQPSALCEYFFKEVITLYCAWDSHANAMRIMAEAFWQHSVALYHTIQSMGAACLATTFPHLAAVAVQERAQAIRLLQTHSSGQEDRLLAAWLLGHTASWHEPQDLAVELFRENCLIVRDSAANGRLHGASVPFFEEAIDYWAMLLAFFTKDHSQNPLRTAEPASSPSSSSPESSLPHPWTGISRLTVRMLTEVGQLVFRHRSRMLSRSGFLTETDMDAFREALRTGRALERRLLSYRPVNVSDILDPGDPRTSTGHLHAIDEAYRHTGLLQLYRVFPDLLAERYSPWKAEEILWARPATKQPSRTEQDVWRTKLAIYILDILREIPFESGTRCLQPFILVAVASELRCVYTENRVDDDMIAIAQARRFVSSRLSAYTHILPLRKVRKMIELVDSIWSALDSGQQDVYWMDIADQKQLRTLLG